MNASFAVSGARIPRVPTIVCDPFTLNYGLPKRFRELMFSRVVPSVDVLRRTRRNAYTIVGAAPDVVIGRSAAVRTGARPYPACDASPTAPADSGC